MKTILSVLDNILINIDQNIIITFISSVLLTTLIIFLVLGLKKISLWVRIYLFFIFWFVLYILFFVYLHLVTDILKYIEIIINHINCLCHMFIMTFAKPMTMGAVLEDSSLADIITSPMDNRSDGGSTPPRSPWRTRPVTPETLVAVTPTNLPNFDSPVWMRGTVLTDFAREQEEIARTGIRSANINPAAVGYFHGRATGAVNHHTIFPGPLYPFTHIQGTCNYDDVFTFNIWVSPGIDTHTYYVTKEDYNTIYQLSREEIIREDSRLKEVKSMTSHQRWIYFNKEAEKNIKLNFQHEWVTRILNGHQIPLANQGA